jgi:multicomponent Na+:H+ antiporter subunit C
MEILMAFVVGLLFTAGIYLTLRKNILKLVIGLSLLSHGANLLLITMGNLKKGGPPILQNSVGMVYNDPLPPALILTAIVIGFGVTAFTLVLVYRAYQETNCDNLDEMGRSE